MDHHEYRKKWRNLSSAERDYEVATRFMKLKGVAWELLDGQKYAVFQSGSELEHIPWYSSSISDAWKVYEEISKRPYQVRYRFACALADLIATPAGTPHELLNLSPDHIALAGVLAILE